MSRPSPYEVLIAGGGAAALEAVPAFLRLAPGLPIGLVAAGTRLEHAVAARAAVPARPTPDPEDLR